ncbi:MAG TPA: biopolymer transporter ExbD [Planctomycetota bacterium]|nr:biopolymer transporter ExbD [Planctomycetota bacterium]
MSGKKTIQLQEDVAPNLIPMIDIMFLLLLFFMLGADMGQRDIEDVVLPLASSVKEDKDEGKKEKNCLTINVFHRYAKEVSCLIHSSGKTCREDSHWRIGVRGVDYTQAEKLAALLDEEADRFRGDSGNAKTSERKVMVRADGNAPYGAIQDIMGACARVGIYKIECGAARPAEERGGAARV